MNENQPTTGKNLTLIVLEGDRETGFGKFRQTELKKWKEVSPSGHEAFSFDETGRDESSVYLRDPTRDVALQLDLSTNTVRDRSNNSVVNNILRSYSTITGWLLNEASVSLIDGRPQGFLRQIGPKSWGEFRKNGALAFRFIESNRDDWSVYLLDKSRGVRLKVDMHRRKVMYNDENANRFDFYEITDATQLREQPYLFPPLTGTSVNLIDIVGESRISNTSAHPTRTGKLRQTGLYTWVAQSELGDATFHYLTEIKRHNSAIFLYAPEWDATLEVNLATNKVFSTTVAGTRREYATITKTYNKINGWTANRVSVRSKDLVPVGEFRQTGEKSWVALDGDHHVTSRLFEETRDNWSVYLQEPVSRERFQLDLNTATAYRQHGTAPKTELHSIERASSKPGDVLPAKKLPVNSRNVNLIQIGKPNGEPTGTYRKTGPDTWVELIKGKAATRTFQEVTRDGSSLELQDNPVTLHFNFDRRRVGYRDANQTIDKLYSILYMSANMHGWGVSEVSFAHLGNDTELGKYRQTESDAWIEQMQDGKTRHFKEITRDDWSVVLQDSVATIELDLRAQRVIYNDANTKDRHLYNILTESIEPGIWLHSEKITSRTSMTEDFDVERQGQAKLKPRPVYRTSVTVTPVTSSVDVWASEEVTVEIDGKSFTIDPVKAATVKPSALSKISISVPASDVHCPHLVLRTNLMMPEQRHYIFPDVESHKKIVGLQKGDLAKARTQLGIADQFTDEDLDHFQRSLQNVAKTVQHTYNKTPHGIHHDRALLPTNMEHPHFMIDFSDGGARYKPLHPSEVPALIAGSRSLQGDAAQGFFDKVGNFFKKAGRVIVHTVENVGHDVVQTFENIGSDAVHTVEKVGEDVIHGDLGDIGHDVMQGGENIGKDLVKGAINVGGDVISGAKKLVVITLQAGEELVHYVLTHTGEVGEVLSKLFDKIGAGIEKVVDWLLDKIGWSDVLHAHDVLVDKFNRGIDKMETYPEMLKARSDKFFTHMVDLLSDDIDLVLKDIGVLNQTKQPQPVSSHSGAVEKVEWLLGKLTHHSSEATSLVFPAMPTDDSSPVGQLINLIEQQFGVDGSKILGAIEASVGDIKHFFTDSNHAPEYLLGAILEIVKAVAIISLDALKVIFDFILDLIVDALQSFKKMMNDPWDIPFIGDLYEAITEGRQLSFLSFTCLAISIPATIISKAEFKAPLFERQSVAAADLTELEGNVRAYGIVYGVCHIVLAPVAVFSDVRTGISANQDSWGKTFGPAFGEAPDNAPAGVDKFGAFLTALDLATSYTAQLLGNPIPLGEEFVIPLDHAKDDVFEAPNYWAHAIWWFQWAGLGVNTIFAGVDTFGGGGVTTVAGNVSTVFNFAWGIVHTSLMGVLDQRDRHKKAALADGNLLDAEFFKTRPLELFQELEAKAKEKVDSKEWQPYWHFTDTTTEDKGITVAQWVENMRNYLKWATLPIGISNKGFGNVMDCFPEIGQIGAMPLIADETVGLSLIGTGFFDILGHLGEGITYIVRTRDNELL